MNDQLSADRETLYPNMPTSVEVIDCTLRDGEQAPGVWFTIKEKVDLAARLSAAGVAVLDAGFPASSEWEVEALQEMRSLDFTARIGATARPVKRDLEAAKRARAHEVFLFFPTSDLRIHETMGVDRARARVLMRAGAEEAAGLGLGVNIVFEDATRSDLVLMAQMLEDVCPVVPVNRVLLADTVGCSLPLTIERLVRNIRKHLPDETAIGIHTHNDYGLAGANTISAVIGGASAVTCTVNGVGERAGNADLAETVAALEHLLGVHHGIDATMLQGLSATVEELTGLFCSPMKPVTGSNVFRHESGIHVDGMLKDKRAYEHLPASWVGRSHEYILGKNSGTALLRRFVDEQGIECDDDTLRELLGYVQEKMMTRPKTEHARAVAAKRAFEQVSLVGVSPAMVLARVMHKSSGFFTLSGSVAPGAASIPPAVAGAAAKSEKKVG